MRKSGSAAQKSCASVLHACSQEQLRVQRAKRPRSFSNSEHQAKECAGSRKATERKMGRGRTCSKAMCPERAASYKSFASRAVPGRTRLSTASTNQRSAPAAERKKRGRTGGPALVCPQRAPTKGVRRQQKGRKKAGRAGRDRALALKTVPCRCWSAFPGRTRLPTVGLFFGQMGAGKLAKVLFVASLLASQSAAEWRSG